MKEILNFIKEHKEYFKKILSWLGKLLMLVVLAFVMNIASSEEIKLILGDTISNIIKAFCIIIPFNMNR